MAAALRQARCSPAACLAAPGRWWVLCRGGSGDGDGDESQQISQSLARLIKAALPAGAGRDARAPRRPEGFPRHGRAPRKAAGEGSGSALVAVCRRHRAAWGCSSFFFFFPVHAFPSWKMQLCHIKVKILIFLIFLVPRV